MKWFTSRGLLGLFAALSLLCVAGCGHHPVKPEQQPAWQQPNPQPGAPQASAPAATAPGGWQASATATGGVRTYDVSGEPLVEGILVGKPKLFGNMTVFPILAKTQPDVGPVTSLDLALEAGTAEVRELDGGGSQPRQRAEPVQQAQSSQPQQPSSLPSRPNPIANSPPQVQQISYLQGGGGAQVGTLVIDNKGAIPIYVLAGTVVKGGKQDRQIGQDFVVPPLSKVPVDAFCVEQGRWTATRDGKSTGGKFKTLKQLATAKVRKAGQYEANQGKVWKQVAAVNQANQKQSASDTLMATLDDPEVANKRDALSKRVLSHLQTTNPAGAVVGFAYAVDGKVEGARWFANHELFALFREALVNTSAVDSITAQRKGPSKAPKAVAPGEIARFVAEVDRAADKKIKKTKGANVNEYLESDRAYGSSTVVKRPGKPAVKLSSDYVLK